MRGMIVRAGGITAAAALLGGCALLRLAGGGGGDPAQLYRFDASVPGEATRPASATLQLSNLVFQSASDGDRLLAVHGSEAFYIADARWVTPARDLFSQAAERAFGGVGLRLARRGQPFEPDAGLVLTAATFETRYEGGLQAPPTVVVEVRAAMLGDPGRAVLGETAFTARQPAAANTVPQIVAAYDAATRQALDHVARWAASTVVRAP